MSRILSAPTTASSASAMTSLFHRRWHCLPLYANSFSVPSNTAIQLTRMCPLPLCLTHQTPKRHSSCNGMSPTGNLLTTLSSTHLSAYTSDPVENPSDSVCETRQRYFTVRAITQPHRSSPNLYKPHRSAYSTKVSKTKNSSSNSWKHSNTIRANPGVIQSRSAQSSPQSSSAPPSGSPASSSSSSSSASSSFDSAFSSASSDSETPSVWSYLFGGASIAAVGVMSVLTFILTRFFTFTHGDGVSMLPTLTSNDCMLIDFFHPLFFHNSVLKPSAIVVLFTPDPARPQSRLTVKRIRAVAGEEIEAEKRNGAGMVVGWQKVKVDEGKVWVEGDGVESNDSRTYGAIDQTKVVGRVRAIVWPPTRWRLV